MQGSAIALSWIHGRRGFDQRFLSDLFSADGYGLDRNLESDDLPEGPLAAHQARLPPDARSRGFAGAARATGWRKGRPDRDALPVVRDVRRATNATYS
jgi:hypothetical protein